MVKHEGKHTNQEEDAAQYIYWGAITATKTAIIQSFFAGCSVGGAGCNKQAAIKLTS